MSSIKAIKSYKGFEEGSYAARKGRLCLIKKIHFEMHPPSVTVLMKDTDTEVGTEFDRLKHIKSWFCDICTAENNDVSANQCSFCKMNRSFKEKIIIQDENEQNEQKQMEQPQESKSENTKQSEAKELESSSESDETESDQTEQEPKDEIDEDHEYEIIDAPHHKHKEPEYEQEEDQESEYEEEDEDEDEDESEYEQEPQDHRYGYRQRQRPRYNGYNGYYDDEEYAKYQDRNRSNRNRNRMNRNRDPFGFGWNAFPSFDRFFL